MTYYIGDYIIKYWDILLTLLGFAGFIITVYFGQKEINRVMKADLVELKGHMEKHDAADLLMKSELTALIERNKNSTETASKEIQGTLGIMGQDLAVLKNNFNLFLGGKIKTDSNE